MKKILTLLMFVLILNSIRAQISTQTVTLTTGTSAMGVADPLWSCMVAGSSVYQTSYSGMGTSVGWASSALACGKWTSPYINSLGSPYIPLVDVGDFTYRLIFNTTSSCHIVSAQFNINSVGADNTVSNISINGHPYSYTTAGFINTDIRTGITIPVNPSYITAGSNTVTVVVHNNDVRTGFHMCGDLTINYDVTPIVPSFVPNVSTLCSHDPLVFDGSSSTGPIQNHYWEMAECDAYSNIVSGGYSYSTWVSGMPGSFTFPTAPCNKYYRFKLAVQNSCNVWVETTRVIYYECNPSFSVSSTSIGDCIGGTNTLSTSISGVPGFTYNWQAPGATGTGSSFPVTISNVAQTATVTVSAPHGCSTTKTYTVSPGGSSYCCQTANQILNGGTVAALGGSSYTGGLIEINGTLLINTNFTFSGTLLRMAPNAKIVVGPGANLTLTNCHLFACSYMWEGIELSDGSTLNANTSTIDDANIAVLSNAASTTTAPVINMTSTVMCKNYYGIEVQNYTGGATYPITLSGVDMRGNFASTYSPGTNFKPYKRLWIPDIIIPASTEYGILLQNVSLVSIGSGTSATNYFRNMKCGIRSMNSNASVNKCYFTNLPMSLSSYGVGIWSSGTNGGSINGGNGYEYILNAGIIPGPNTNTANTFLKVGMGIVTTDCISSQIENNKFFDIDYAAVTISGSDYLRTVSPGNFTRNYAIVRNNLIRKLTVGMLNGILLQENKSINATVQTNTISVIPSTSSTGEGIVTQNSTLMTAPYGSKFIVDGNTITDQAQNGIRVENIFTSQYTNNTINLTKTYSKGIFLVTSAGNTVKGNIIDASFFPDYWNSIDAICLNASSTQSCPNNKIWCNKTIRTNTGFSSFLDCSGTNIDGNTFDGCRIGMNIYYSVIGQQGSPYTGSFTGAVANDFKNSSISIMSDHSNGALSPYYTVPVSGFQCIPTVVTNISGTNVPVYTTTANPQGQLACIILTRVVKDIENTEEVEADANRLGEDAEVKVTETLSVYPNPANEILFIKGKGLEGAEIVITDLLGTSVKKTMSFSAEGIDVRDLANGSYLMQIKTTDGGWSKVKVVIIK